MSISCSFIQNSCDRSYYSMHHHRVYLYMFSWEDLMNDFVIGYTIHCFTVTGVVPTGCVKVWGPQIQMNLIWEGNVYIHMYTYTCKYNIKCYFWVSLDKWLMMTSAFVYLNRPYFFFNALIDLRQIMQNRTQDVL